MRQPDGLDVVASRRGDTVYLHVANTRRTRSVKATIQIAGQVIRGGRVFEIAEDPAVEVSYLNDADVMQPREKPFASDGVWEFPAASVSALELPDRIEVMVRDQPGSRARPYLPAAGYFPSTASSSAAPAGGFGLVLTTASLGIGVPYISVF